ncbi:MAG: terminase small subunit [Rickettsiales bacterium]|jgi:phage terminase small subunit|nr:terminase small subunit [Rickettsiales bacterium]
MTQKLTLKKEKFCQEYIKNGGNATQAYRDVYNCARMADKTVNENASRLLKDSKVIARLNDLKSNLQKKFEYAAEQSFKKLESVQQLALSEEYKNLNAYLKAEDLIQKITGLQKQMGDKDNPIYVNNTLSIEKLKELKEKLSE